MDHLAAHQQRKIKYVRRKIMMMDFCSIDIKADAAKVWTLLTQASDYPRRNSTVTSIEGSIAPGAGRRGGPVCTYTKVQGALARFH